MTKTARTPRALARGTYLGDDLAPIRTERTRGTEPLRNVALDGLLQELDSTFAELTTSGDARVTSGQKVTVCVVGDSGDSFVWRGSAHFRPNDTGDVLWMFYPEALQFDPIIPVEDEENVAVMRSVEKIKSQLGLTEGDILAAAGISERTYYNWKRNKETTPRRASQASLWAVAESAERIVQALRENAATWMKADPERHKLFVAGQHARLALLADAAKVGVRIPSETLDELHVPAAEDVEALKRFRTTHPVKITHDEDGNALRPVTEMEAAFYPDEAEDDLVMIELDD